MALDWRLSDRVLTLDRPLGAGIVNVTSDSMFSGARSETPEGAVADGVALARAGFDMLDVGAVAARGGPAVDPGDEASRLLPAIVGLKVATGLPISADTFSAEVAEQALDAGAVVINDISGALDPALFDLAAERGCGLVLMHIEGRPREDRGPPRFDDPVEHLKSWFAERIEAAGERGSMPSSSCSTPASTSISGWPTASKSCAVWASCESSGARSTSASRARTCSARCSPARGRGGCPPERREWATCAATALAVMRGADIHRLHDASALQAMRIAGAIAGGEAAARPYTGVAGG